MNEELSVDGSIPAPRVSIGLPVYNGDPFLEKAIESILAQTFSDLELIISDNASTDRTQEICERFQRMDPRVRYFRQPKNLGAGPNYNFTFHQARGEFFKWAAHDDVLEPTLVERCVETLDEHPDAQLAFTKTMRIDEHGVVVGKYKDYDGLNLDSRRPHRRFGDMVCGMHNCVAVFGLLRRDQMESTMLHPTYEDGDRHFLAEISLRGRLIEVPEYLFQRRDHPGAYTSALPRGERIQWWDTSKAGRITFPEWKSLGVYFDLIRRSTLGTGEKALCYMQLIRYLFGPRWYRQRWVKLIRDGLVGTYHLSRRAIRP